MKYLRQNRPQPVFSKQNKTIEIELQTITDIQLSIFDAKYNNSEIKSVV